MANELNVKNFILTIQNLKSYQIVVDGFSKTSLWFITFTQRMPIVANLLLTLKATTSILNKITINYGTMFLTTKMTASIANSPIFTTIAKLIYKITTSISNTIVFVYAMRLRTKMLSVMSILHDIDLTMIVAVFNLLGDYDTDTLGTMDTEILGDLDYTIA